MPTKIDMAKFAKFCKDMGFIFQSSEIYGGINGFWDYGPLGVELKKNIKDAWWLDMVRNPPPGPPDKDGNQPEIRMAGLDCSIIMNPKVWVASGHVGGFADPMVDCLKCRKRFRADKVWFAKLVEYEVARPVFGGGDYPHRVVRVFSTQADNQADATANFKEERQRLAKKRQLTENSDILGITSAATAPAGLATPCPEPDCDGTLTPPRAFNLMFESFAGAIQSEENKVYLRPETAQGIFANYRNVLDSTRLKLPFGVAQVGKAFRNEINPRNLHLPQPRIRADGNRVLLPPGRSR